MAYALLLISRGKLFMVDGNDIVMMPGALLGWLLIGFVVLAAVAGVVYWLTSGSAAEPRAAEDPFEDMARDQLERDRVMNGNVDQQLPAEEQQLDEAIAREKRIIEEQR